MLNNPNDPRLQDMEEFDTCCRIAGVKPAVYARSLTIDGTQFRYPAWARYLTVDRQGTIRACDGPPVERADRTWNYQTCRVEYVGSTSGKTARKIPIPLT